MIEIALGQQRSLFEFAHYPSGFNQEAIEGLARHGHVWKWLLVIATDKGKEILPQPTATDPFYEQIRNEKSEWLKALFLQKADEAEPLVRAWKHG